MRRAELGAGQDLGQLMRERAVTVYRVALQCEQPFLCFFNVFKLTSSCKVHLGVCNLAHMA